MTAQFPEDVVQRLRAEATLCRARQLAGHNAVFAAACVYHGRGLHPHPINPDSKRPYVTWKAFQERPPTLAELVGWWQQWSWADLGLITGRVPGIIALDVDVQHGGSIDGLEIPAGAYIQRSRSGGWHYVFRHPGGRVPNSVGRIRPGVDLRGDGGHFKCAPSPGYTAEAGVLDPAVLPLPPAWLLNGFAAAEPAAPEPGWFESLLRDPCPEGERNDRATRLAGYLLRRGLSAAETSAVLHDWRERCAPGMEPFSEDELSAVIASIAAREGAKAPEQPALRLHLVQDLPDAPIEFTVDGLLPKGTLSVLFGPDKICKTLLAESLAAAIRKGEPFLGHFATAHGPVIMLLLDDPPALSRERLVTQLGLGEDTGLSVACHLDADTEHPMRLLDALREEALRRRPAMIVLDALYVLLEGSEQLHLAGGLRPLLRRLDRIAEESGAAVLLIHHARRSDDEIAGSFAIRASAKCILRLTKPRGEGDDDANETEAPTARRILRIQTKYAVESKYALSYDPASSWVLHGEAAEVRRAELTSLLYVAVGEQPGLTGDQLAERINRRRGDVLDGLRRLADDGRLRFEDQQTRGRPRRCWFLRSDPPAHGFSSPSPGAAPPGVGREGGDGLDPAVRGF